MSGCVLRSQINFRGQMIEGMSIPAGAFLMGSTKGLELERPVHEVEIPSPIWMGKVPVTQAQWFALLGDNPSEFQWMADLPVENVSWDDCQIFCAELSGLTGHRVRLPTESEWEYACRAESGSEFFFGDGEQELVKYAWFDLNSCERSQPVGGKSANAWGLHDMAGNVWEWCEDVWCADYVAAPTDGRACTKDSATQPRRVLRGGAWSYDGFRCRSAYRSREWRHFRSSDFGFRIVWE